MKIGDQVFYVRGTLVSQGKVAEITDKGIKVNSPLTCNVYTAGFNLFKKKEDAENVAASIGEKIAQQLKERLAVLGIDKI
jgi:triacylglycerol esterase/lipase EstA (alpha/beta hydrolase family)